MSRSSFSMRALMPLRTVFMVLIAMLLPVAAFAQVKAVATFSVLGDVVRHVGGDKIALTVMVGADGDAHTFEPTPADNKTLTHADIIFENGLYFEHWLNSLYQASASTAKRIVVTEGVEPISLATHERMDAQGDPEDVDPHAWHDVENVIIMAQRVCDGLSVVDPAHAAYYQANTTAYLAQLSDLDAWIIDRLKDVPTERRQFVTAHDALGYFATRYGFKIVGAVIPSATTEAEDPSAKQTAALIDLIKSTHVKVLFAENIHSKKLAEALARETGVRLESDLYTDALGREGSDGATYIQMMRHNVNIFAESL